MSGSAVRQGGVYIEIGADPRQLFATLNRINAKIAAMGRRLSNAGGSLVGIGMGAAAPFAAAASAGARFDDVLRNVSASTKASPQELEAVKKAALDMSAAMGIGPTEAAQGMLALLKAGESLENVLGGVGKAAIEFAKVGELDITTAAETMKNAMNVFGVSAQDAANALSAAADASSTSIASMTESFSMSAAVAAMANQSITDLSAALAVMANNGVRGSDAGTSIKTMLMRLMAPADEAIGALQSIGLSTASFRDAAGNMLPMVEIIRVLNNAMGDMDKTAKDDIFRRVFGSDAIRAAQILTSAGVDGLEAMQDAMSNALPVGEKFKILMGGLSGSATAILGSLERLAIAIGEAIAPAMAASVPIIRGFVDGLTNLVKNNKDAVALIFNVASGSIAAGAGLLVAGKAIGVASGAIGLLMSTATAALSPLAMLGRTAVFAGGSFASVASGIASGAGVAAGAIARLGSVSGAGLMAVGTLAVRTGALFAASMTAAAAQAFPAFVTGFARATASGAGFFSAVARGLRGQFMAISVLRNGLAGMVSLFGAVAQDGARMAGPIVRSLEPLVAGLRGAATAAWQWAAATAEAVAATVKGAAQVVWAWATQAANAVWGFAASAASALAGYISSAAGAVAATVAAGGRIAGSYMATMLPATSAFVSRAVASLGQYISSVAASAAATVAGAGRIAVAWVAGGMPGLLTFVSGALGAFGAYLGGAAGVVAGSVASAAAATAAWLAPLAPFAALGAAIAGAAALAYSFGGTIRAAMSGIGDMAGPAGESINNAFQGALAEATVVFGDMFATAKTAFAGISDAITNGDIWGAIEILWAGIQAIWLRGQESVMNFIDPWIAFVQNTFTFLGAGIATAWESLWSDMSAILNTAGAVLFGVFDNIVNGIMATWDTLESGVRKAWIRVSGMFGDAKDTKTKLDEVDNEMEARAAQRELARPGVSGRLAKAEKENADNAAKTKDRIDAINEEAGRTAQGRLDANEQRREDRRAATIAAEERVASLTERQAEVKEGRASGDQLIEDLGGAKSMDELREIAAAIHELNARGLLTEGQMDRFNSAADAAAERITDAESGKPSASDAAKNGQKDAEQSKVEMAGTFSAASVAGMGYGSSLAERTAKASERTADATEKMASQGNGAWSA